MIGVDDRRRRGPRSGEDERRRRSRRPFMPHRRKRGSRCASLAIHLRKRISNFRRRCLAGGVALTMSRKRRRRSGKRSRRRRSRIRRWTAPRGGRLSTIDEVDIPRGSTRDTRRSIIWRACDRRSIYDGKRRWTRWTRIRRSQLHIVSKAHRA